MGLVLWALGAAVSVWVGVRSPEVGAFVVGWAIVGSGGMLAAFIADVGSQWRRRTADPVAQAWWMLTLYAIFPPLTTLWVLRDAGVLAWDEPDFFFPLVLAGMLLVRGAVLVSPASRRVLAAEARRPVGAAAARWLAPAAGATYVLVAAATFVAAAVEREWLALGVAVLGFLAIQTGVELVGRRIAGAGGSDDVENAPSQPEDAGRSAFGPDAGSG